MTCEMPCTSRPRAATSVATRTRTPPAVHRLDGAGARALVHVAVQRRDREALRVQVLRHFVRAALGGREHDGLVHLRVAQQVVEQAVLVAQVVGEVQALRDVLVARLLACRSRCASGRMRSAPARRTMFASSVAEKSSVWRAAGMRGDDGLEVVLEAHVEHAVGLVQHQHLQAREVDAARLHLVEEASRGGDEDVDAGLQEAVLRRVGHAAHDRHRLQARQVAAVGLGGLGDLHGELARGHEHQHARAAAGAGCASVSSCSAGSMKAAVLPLPVCEETIRSPPVSASGMTRSCTAVGAV